MINFLKKSKHIYSDDIKFMDLTLSDILLLISLMINNWMRNFKAEI